MTLTTPPRPKSSCGQLTVPPLRTHPTWREEGVPNFLPIKTTSLGFNFPFDDEGRQAIAPLSCCRLPLIPLLLPNEAIAPLSCRRLPLIPLLLPNEEPPICELNSKITKSDKVIRNGKPPLKFRLRQQNSRGFLTALFLKAQEPMNTRTIFPSSNPVIKKRAITLQAPQIYLIEGPISRDTQRSKSQETTKLIPSSLYFPLIKSKRKTVVVKKPAAKLYLCPEFRVISLKRSVSIGGNMQVLSRCHATKKTRRLTRCKSFNAGCA